MAVRDAIVMGIALCETLGAVHREGLLHRDLLPDNVVMRGGRIDDIWLVDFGRAGPADAGPRMRYGKFVEVPGFYDTGCELAQVCAIVHHCLTMARAEGIRAGATPPHRRPGFLLEERARREPGDEAVICAVNLLFDRGLSADRARRFRSAGELGRAFEMALEGRAPPEPGSRIGDERPSRGGFAGSSWAGWTGRFPWPLDATRAPFDMALDAVTAWLADAVGRVAGFPDCAAQ